MGGSWTGVLKVTVVVALAGLLWVLGSVEMRDGRNGPAPDSLVKSERKRAGDGRTAGADGRTRVEREPRSLEELQEEFDRICREVEETNGGDIYLLDATDPPPEVRAWLDGLTEEEIVLLSKGLFQEGLRNATSRNNLTKHSLMGILVAAWGRDDPLEAFSYVDGHEDDYTHSIKKSFKAWI